MYYKEIRDDSMREFLYMCKDKNNKKIHSDYKYERILEYFYENKEAVRMYAYTKDVYPFKCLIRWKSDII